MVEPAFRTITNRLILANIKSLILSSDESSNMIDRNHLDIINRIYYTFLSNIKLIIINNKYIRETGYEHFETEWKNYKQDISSIVEDLISQSFLIIPFNLEDLVEDYPRILKLQKNELDTFKSCLIVFMTLHDIRQMIYQEKDLIRNGFPLKLGGFELDTEQIYNLQNLGLEMYNCKVKVGSNFYDYIMLVYQNNLYFGLPDNKDQLFTMIKYKYALRHLEAQIDRGDPRILNLIVYEKGKYMEIALAFEDVTRTTAIKKNLEEHRKSARNTEYLLLDSYFDDLISKWKF